MKCFRNCILGVLAVSTMLGAVPVFAMETNTEADINSNYSVEPRAHQFVVKADVLNVRSGPGTSYSIVGKLYYGDLVWLDPDTDWVEGWTGIYGTNSKGYYVQGYVSTEYIENIS